MAGRYRFLISSLLVAFMALPIAAECAKKPAAPKAAPKAAVKKVAAALRPKVLTVVAGRPFEAVTSSGSSAVSITMCPEETEPATFTVRYGKPLANVKVSAQGDLVGPGKIARSNVAVSRVADGVNLITTGNDSDGTAYTEANISSSPTQMWVDVTVPARTKPGTYKGAVAFTSKGKTIDIVPIEVKVLALRLVLSSKQYAVYTSYGPAGEGASQLAGPDYQRFLSSWAKCGFRGVTINAGPNEIADALYAYTVAGLSSPARLVTYAFNSRIPTVDELQVIENAKKSSTISAIHYFSLDNPSTAGEAGTAQLQLNVMHSIRGFTVSRVSDQATLDQIEPLLDGIDYAIDMPGVQSLINGNAKRTSPKMDWLWWDAKKSVWDNRINAGIALWRAGLYGALPLWMPDEGSAPAEGVNSILSEAMREGIDDTRYITTYSKSMRELKDLKRPKDKDYIQSSEDYLNAFMSKPLSQVSAASLMEFRAKMVSFTTGLQSRM